MPRIKLVPTSTGSASRSPAEMSPFRGGGGSGGIGGGSEGGSQALGRALGGLVTDAMAQRKAAEEEAQRKALGQALLGLATSQPALAPMSGNFAPTVQGYPASPSPVTRTSTFYSKAIPSFAASAGEKYGISPDFMTKTAWIESKGNPNAVSSTGATGLYQFTRGTAAQFGLGDRRDPVASADAAARLAASNRDSLTRRLGRDPSDAELYLAHQQGSAGAGALLANPNANVVDALAGAYGGNRAKAAQAVTVNGGRTDMTAGAFANRWTNKFDGLSSRRAEADMPAPGALPVQGTAAGMERRDGFAIPPASQGSDPMLQRGPYVPDPNADPASMIQRGPYTPAPGMNPADLLMPAGTTAMGDQTGFATEPAAPPPAPADVAALFSNAPMGPAQGFVPPEAPPLEMTVRPSSLEAPAMPSAPLPPPRPQEPAAVAPTQQALGRALMSAPLPPERPDELRPADIPVESAQEVRGAPQQAALGRALLTSDPNARDAGAGEFARGNPLQGLQDGLDRIFGGPGRPRHAGREHAAGDRQAVAGIGGAPPGRKRRCHVARSQAGAGDGAGHRGENRGRRLDEAEHRGARRGPQERRSGSAGGSSSDRRSSRPGLGSSTSQVSSPRRQPHTSMVTKPNRMPPTAKPMPNCSLTPLASQCSAPITIAKAMQQIESQKPRRSTMRMAGNMAPTGAYV